MAGRHRATARGARNSVKVLSFNMIDLFTPWIDIVREFHLSACSCRGEHAEMINDFSWLVLSPRLSLCSRSREHAERRVHARRENECLNKDFNLSHTHEPHINHRFVKRTSSDGIFSFFFLLFVRNKSISADGFLPTLLTRNSMNSLISHRNSHRSANIHLICERSLTVLEGQSRYCHGFQMTSFWSSRSTWGNVLSCVLYTKRCHHSMVLIYFILVIASTVILMHLQSIQKHTWYLSSTSFVDKRDLVQVGLCHALPPRMSLLCF